jgi:hypothetical protein
MSAIFSCDDKEALVAYLYDEADTATQRQVESHLRHCGTCSAEAAALSHVRSELLMWGPPEAELGFAVSQPAPAPTAAKVLRPAAWWSTAPAWAQAAAAVFVVAVGLGVANLQITSGPAGVSVTTGWMSPAAPGASASAIAADPATGESWKAALVALEQQLRQEIQAGRETSPVRVTSRSQADDATVRRVQELLEASEARQNRELALRVTQLMRDMDMQRRADLVRIEQGLGSTGAEMVRQRQMLNYVMRTSGTPQQ